MVFVAVVVNEGVGTVDTLPTVRPSETSTGSAASTPEKAETVATPPTALLVVQVKEVSPAVRTWR